jgi:hypothetical protein
VAPFQRDLRDARPEVGADEGRKSKWTSVMTVILISISKFGAAPHELVTTHTDSHGLSFNDKVSASSFKLRYFEESVNFFISTFNSMRSVLSTNYCCFHVRKLVNLPVLNRFHHVSSRFNIFSNFSSIAEPCN